MSNPNPRLGLRDPTRALYDAGALPDGTMQALGATVAGEMGLVTDACN